MTDQRHTAGKSRDERRDRTLGEQLAERGVSRRAFLKYSAYLASLLALPPSAARVMAETLAKVKRQPVIWLSFQECTGCTESITRSNSPTLEELIFNLISLDYHHTLQSASGEAAEEARRRSMDENKGKYIVVVDGSVPLKDGGIYSAIAGESNVDMLKHTAENALAVIAVGTCAAYGGLPLADPNPTGAVAISKLVGNKPVINIPGCPPIPEAMAGTIAHVLAFGTLPELDQLGRPKAFFGDTIHDRCYRRPYYDKGLFAHSFDDEGARKGWCLFEVGCKGPITYNACAMLKWNSGTSFPIQSGHGCIGCSEPNFWDMGGVYSALSKPAVDIDSMAAAGLAAGAAAGLGVAALNRLRKSQAKSSHEKVTVDDLTREETK